MINSNAFLLVKGLYKTSDVVDNTVFINIILIYCAEIFIFLFFVNLTDQYLIFQFNVPRQLSGLPYYFTILHYINHLNTQKHNYNQSSICGYLCHAAKSERRNTPFGFSIFCKQDINSIMLAFFLISFLKPACRRLVHYICINQYFISCLGPAYPAQR